MEAIEKAVDLLSCGIPQAKWALHSFTRKMHHCMGTKQSLSKVNRLKKCKLYKMPGIPGILYNITNDCKECIARGINH